MLNLGWRFSTIPPVNKYLLTLVLKADLDEKTRKELLDAMLKKALGKGGKAAKEDMWGVRDLAYPIKKQTKGYYAHYELETDPANVKDLDKVLKVEEDILRYLLTRAD